ncbi:MAG: ArsR family transcriptional regulator [Bacteroidetes bacterium]|nr:ArsR family transcriptional regulator [Bacteroidota bacterium]MCH8524610.1 metalloregulator ArsR/SmtB family transcription factor [Balneolales bacterium]
MNSREVKTALYKEIATVTKALGNPHRLEILDLLAQGPVPVEYISEHINLPLANASQHLQVLKKANLVNVERKGKYIFYALSNDHVYDVWKSLRKLGFNQNQEVQKLVDEYRQQREDLQVICAEELIQKLETNDIILVDVRPDEEYRLGHIQGAVSIPYTEIREYLKELPVDKEIVAYCRGPLCMMADNVVQLLNRSGFKAYRLDVGVPECESFGIALEAVAT